MGHCRGRASIGADLLDLAFGTAPTNGFGMIIFYLDEDGDGAFDVEKDTFTKLGEIPLAFDPSLVKRS